MYCGLLNGLMSIYIHDDEDTAAVSSPSQRQGGMKQAMTHLHQLVMNAQRERLGLLTVQEEAVIEQNILGSEGKEGEE